VQRNVACPRSISPGLLYCQILSPPLREGSTESEGSCVAVTTPRHNPACWFSDRSTRNSARRAIRHRPAEHDSRSGRCWPPTGPFPRCHRRSRPYPAVDLDGEAVSCIAASAAEFVSKGLDPIPSLVIESCKHLWRPPPESGSGSRHAHEAVGVDLYDERVTFGATCAP
jgi:hypothetical protein